MLFLQIMNQYDLYQGRLMRIVALSTHGENM